MRDEHGQQPIGRAAKAQAAVVIVREGHQTVPESTRSSQPLPEENLERLQKQNILASKIEVEPSQGEGRDETKQGPSPETAIAEVRAIQPLRAQAA